MMKDLDRNVVGHKILQNAPIKGLSTQVAIAVDRCS